MVVEFIGRRVAVIGELCTVTPRHRHAILTFLHITSVL